jgi:hypothetical protein
LEILLSLISTVITGRVVVVVVAFKEEGEAEGIRGGTNEEGELLGRSLFPC